MAVKLSEKIGYGLGDAAAGGITWKVMSIAFPLFFTNIFGLTVADTATLMLVARLFDVVTDPMMGALADRTQSKWGTYRPWLIFGAIPLGVVFALLLYTPDFGPVGKRIWAYSLYLLMMAVYTAVNVPYGSLLGVMTDDDDEKNQFSSYRMVGAYAMGFVTLLSFPYLQKVVGGTEQHQYAVLGVVLGGLAALAPWLAASSPKSGSNPSAQRNSPSSLSPTFSATNPGFISPWWASAPISSTASVMPWPVTCWSIACTGM